MRKETGELVPIKVIKRLIRNYGKGRKLMINSKYQKVPYLKRSIVDEFV